MSRRQLDAGWELVESLNGSADRPPESGWKPAVVPGTVASSLRALGEWGFRTPKDFDAGDWWYRCRFSAEEAIPGRRRWLRFEGLATAAEVWLNGEPLFRSNNMFTSKRVEVGTLLKAENELSLRFESMLALLKAKRPRPRWKTRMVEQQQLRWWRTTLLGRMPGWSPPVAPVGPWRPVWLEEDEAFTVERLSVQAERAGSGGRVRVSMNLRTADGLAPSSARFRVHGEESSLALRSLGPGQFALAGELLLNAVEPWWPHTHGPQPLYPVDISIHAGGVEGGVEGGKVGFRSIEASREGGGFSLAMNGVSIFARGACWTPLDVVSLQSTPQGHRRALEAVRDAGMNLIRLSGTLVYESDAFHSLCDELGILVWQDFMFANMDYPADDSDFQREVREEATQLLQRLAGRPSLAVLCGSSEVEQQAAMLGLPRESWRSALFDELLPAWCTEHAPGTPYLSSSPTGGTLPFHADEGVTHYYGVGAYLRPLEDARRAQVRFASECLAFSNVPEPAMVSRVLGNGQSPVHHPAWKERVPRDNGSSWDFEDVRDHYLQTVFGVDPPRLRREDLDRYLALSRVVTGEVMASTISEWRRAQSSCRGALVWFLRDLWPGAGWGVFDSEGEPKAALYYLQRVCAPVALFLSDEGVNGLVAHASNDGPTPLHGELRFTAWRDGEVRVLSAAIPLEVPAHSSVSRPIEAMLEHFADTSYAYRFGPPSHQLSVAEWVSISDQRTLGQAFHFSLGLPSSVESGLGLEAQWLHPDPNRHLRLRVSTRRFAQSVRIEVPGWRCADNYFHLRPGQERVVLLTSDAPERTARGTVQALNGDQPVKIQEERPEGER